MKPETRSYYEQSVQRAIDHIARHLDEAVDLNSLASGACLSPFHFHRVFRGMVGETAVELARRLRLERAAWQLMTSDRTVTQIAFDAGYDTHEAFTRAFRTSYATSPSGFRRRTHPRTVLAAACGVHFDAGGAVPSFIATNSGGHTMEVDLKEMPALRVAGVRHVGPYNQIALAFERLGAIAGPTGLFAEPGTMMIGLYHDDPDAVPASELRSDAGLSIPEDVPMPDGLTEERIAAGRYACTTHLGSYEHLGDTWARFMGEWIPASGQRIGPGVSFEVYRNTPMQVPTAELVTELYVPLD